jgi:hypothetical protein
MPWPRHILAWEEVQHPCSPETASLGAPSADEWSSSDRPGRTRYSRRVVHSRCVVKNEGSLAQAFRALVRVRGVRGQGDPPPSICCTVTPWGPAFSWTRTGRE